VTFQPPVFRLDANPPFDLFERIQAVDGITITRLRDPGVDREALLAGLRRHYESLAARLDAAVVELRDLVAEHEPMNLVASVAIPAGMGFLQRSGAGTSAATSVTWPAKVEYLLGVALAVPPGDRVVSRDAVGRVLELVSDVFDGAQARLMLDAFDAPRSEDSNVDEALLMLRHEHLVDRMPGYAAHVELIDREVFGPHRDFYLRALGFDPADVAAVVRRRIAACQGRADRALPELRKLAARRGEDAAGRVPSLIADLTDNRIWRDGEVARDTDVPADQVLRMLDYFSAKFGCQPSFRLPSDTNAARTRPAVALDDGAFFLADPWSLMSAVHDRLSQDSAVKDAYQRHRERGHERVAAAALSRVFPQGAVRANQHYAGAEGPGEVDVLVRGRWPLLVEAKAHSLTPSGRRGAPDRVRRVTGSVLDGALNQTRRASQYVLAGGRVFSSRQGAPARDQLPDGVTAATEILVTFERMDPLAMAGPALAGEGGRPVWIVSAADLVLVADLLDHPAAFHHYARLRAAMTAVGLRVYMESDALGAYLSGHLPALLEQATTQTDAVQQVGYFSDAINDYYTRRELGANAARPSDGVPGEVADAMSAAFARSCADWGRASDVVMCVDAGTWRRWRSFRRRHRQGMFDLAPDMRLVLGGAQELSSVGGAQILGVAARTLRR
jgi:hypothetical protein